MHVYVICVCVIWFTTRELSPMKAGTLAGLLSNPLCQNSAWHTQQILEQISALASLKFLHHSSKPDSATFTLAVLYFSVPNPESPPLIFSFQE